MIHYTLIQANDPDIVIDGVQVATLGRREVRALCRLHKIEFDPAVGKQDLLGLLWPLSRRQKTQRLVAEAD